MAYRFGNREQISMLPPSIEDYVFPDDPVRVYDAFVEALDINDLGIIWDQKKVGNPKYNPKAMLKLAIYGYSYGKFSSRKLERATYHNISFIWLMGGLRPDHKTIANFRKNNKKVLKKVLKQCAKLCIELDLIEGNVLFVDGTKIRANANKKNTWTSARCKRYLQDIDKQIESILAKSESIDIQEEDMDSLIKLSESLREKEVLKSKVQEIMQKLKQEEKKSMNTVDPDCTKTKSIQGYHAGYNPQIVVDNKHGLIANSDVVNESNDLNQFAHQINQANETLGKKCKVASGDAGYSDINELKKIDSQGIKVIVPNKQQASNTVVSEFDRHNFRYDSEKDCYYCPAGNLLRFRSIDQKRSRRQYIISKSSICRDCKHFGKCTTSKSGRLITRGAAEDLVIKLEKQYEQQDSQDIYKFRKEKVELPFGHIKRNLGFQSFLMRGLEGAKAEMSILATCFNIRRMISIYGAGKLIQKLVT